MISFPAQPGVEVYASDAGYICFKREDFGSNDALICLTIGQFRKVIKSAPELIHEAEQNKFAQEGGAKNA